MIPYIKNGDFFEATKKGTLEIISKIKKNGG